ncbi:hypothetical protein VNO80_03996 [Phaseolus coccineus]|uniref:Glycine-rich protein n=1 Tax=Phaseolus coccineus TaxID=3886 RepID=A0AAN9NTD4_PHACN
MAKWCILVLFLALAVATTSARSAPTDAVLKDQKNFITYGAFGGGGLGGGTTGIGGIGSTGSGFGGGVGGAHP